MIKVIFVLCIGLAAGYSYGWKDAHVHKQHVVERVVSRVGGSNRGKYDANLDKQAEAAERP